MQSFKTALLNNLQTTAAHYSEISVKEVDGLVVYHFLYP
jgi:hypothetical protein